MIDINKVKQSSELAFEVCWAGIRWIISIAYLALMVIGMADLIVKLFRQIGH